MKQPEDKKTLELPLKNPVGRPRKEYVMSPAMRAREYRERVRMGQTVFKRNGN